MSRFQTALRHRLLDSLKAAAALLGILGLVLLLGSMFGQVTVLDTIRHFSVYGTMMAWLAFILGMITIREDYRLFSQNGVSRRTTFLVELVAMGLLAVGLAALGELLTGMAQAGNRSALVIGDLYQLLFQDGGRLSLVGHFHSGLLNVCLMLAVFSGGLALSTLLYRLSKFWTVVVVLVGLGLPLLLSASGGGTTPAVLPALLDLFQWLFAAPLRLDGGLLLVGLVFSALAWLLFRRAPLKPATK